MSKIKPLPVFEYKIQKFQQINVHTGIPDLTKYRLAVKHANKFFASWYYIQLVDYGKIYSQMIANDLDGFFYDDLNEVQKAIKAFTENERKAYYGICEKRFETVETGIINI